MSLAPFKLGDEVDNPAASRDNPLRTGYFIREVRRSGRTNPGRFYELTDGNGFVWAVGADSIDEFRRLKLEQQVTEAAQAEADKIDWLRARIEGWRLRAASETVPVPLDELRILMATFDELVAGSAWRPIETHRGFDNVLLWNGPRVFLGYRDTDGWRDATDTEPFGPPESPQPTHWMPLPEEPK